MDCVLHSFSRAHRFIAITWNTFNLAKCLVRVEVCADVEREGHHTVMMKEKTSAEKVESSSLVC